MPHADGFPPPTRPIEPIDGEVLVALARSLVRTPSHKRAATKEHAVVSLVADRLRATGLQPVLADVMIDRANLFCTVAGREPGPHLMLCAHSDTRTPEPSTETAVAGGDAPDIVSGLGARAKCGLAAMVTAFVTLHVTKVLTRGAVTLAVLVDREGEGLGAEDLVRSPVRADAAIVAEPTDNRLALGHPGLEFLEIVFTKAAMESTDGADAVLAAVRFVQLLNETLLPSFSQNAHPKLGRPSLVVRGIHGDRAPGQASLCVVTVERRLMPDETFALVCDELAEVIRRVEALAPGLETRLRRVPGTRGTLDHVPLLTDERAPVARAVAEALRRVRGDAGASTVLTTWSDAGMLSFFGGLEAVLLGPGRHTDEWRRGESVSAAEMVEAAQLYVAASLAFCGHMAPGQPTLV